MSGDDWGSFQRERDWARMEAERKRYAPKCKHSNNLKECELCRLEAELTRVKGERDAALVDARRHQKSGRIWAAKLSAMTNWLDKHAPQVWQQGLHDRINDAQTQEEAIDATIAVQKEES